jgi:hypothetical protein
MGSNYQGAGSCIQFKKEVTWGTAVTPTVATPIISSTFKENTATAPSPSLYTGNSGMAKRHHSLRREAGGQVVLPFSFGGIGYLLEAAFGAVVTAGAGPYTHTYTLGGQNQLPSLTVEDVLGDSGNARTYEGVMVTRATFAWSAGDTGGRLTLDLIAETASSPAAKTSLTVDTSDVVMPYDAGTFGWNANTYTLNSVEITIENGIDRRIKLGSLLTKQPQPTNQRRITAKIVLDVDDALEAAQILGTQGDGTITFTSGANSAAWTIQNAYLESAESPRNGHGIVELTVGMLAEDDDTDAGLKLIITNANANYYT